MLTAEGCESRRARLWQSLGGRCDLVVLAQRETLIHLAGFEPNPYEFRSNEGGGILILRPGSSVLVTDATLSGDARAAHVEERLTPVWYDGKFSAPPRLQLLAQNAAAALLDLPGQTIGIESGSVPAGLIAQLQSARPELAIVDISDDVRALRRSKDTDELELLRRSLAASDAAAAAVRDSGRAGMSEFEIYRLMLDAGLAPVGEPARLYGDFVSAPGRTRRGGPPTHRQIQPGDLLLLDYSFVVHGYRGDIATTIQLDGVPDATALTHFEACLEALAAGEQLLRPGTRCRDIDAAVKLAFKERGFESFFTSHSGHGLGLGHPEPPFIVAESDDTLVAGDVVTLEPSQFVPGRDGMRTEHNYLITASGFERLSAHELKLGR